MAQKISKSFTSTGEGDGLLVAPGQEANYTVSGTFSAGWVVSTSPNQNSWKRIASGASVATAAPFKNETNGNVFVRFECTEFASGTMVTSVDEVTSEVQGAFEDQRGNEIFKFTETGLIVDGDLSATGDIAGSSGWLPQPTQTRQSSTTTSTTACP